VPALEQQVILVTGATDEHGRALARELASRGATVLLHGRDAAKGEAMVRELRTSTGKGQLGFYRADLGSLDEVSSPATPSVSCSTSSPPPSPSLEGRLFDHGHVQPFANLYG
jgi:NAD(P)-dependent dehydrogenase (short-subunit alcohol dehydrogenase family)